MRRRLALALLLVGGVVVPPGAGALGVSPVAAQTSSPPAAVEDFAYPGAAQVLADTGITLTLGDGHIQLANCSGAGLIHVWSYDLDAEACFKVNGPAGYLAMSITGVYFIRGDGTHAVTATVRPTGGAAHDVDIERAGWTPIGAGTPASAETLLELVANPADGNLALPVTPGRPFVGVVAVGKPGRSGSRGCSGTLVSRTWVLTAASCFGDSVATGVPAQPTTVSFGGRASVAVKHIVRRTDRDLVLLRLLTPVADLTPAKLSANPLGVTQAVQLAGYGRTATVWAPDQSHVAAAAVSTVTSTTITHTAAGGGVCKGDAGGPVLNGNGNVAGVVSMSGQAGCLDAGSGTNTVVTARTDNIASWINDTVQTSDGKSEFVYIYDDASAKAYRNTQGISQNWGTPLLIGTGWDPLRALYGDLDGDGRDDLVYVYDDGTARAYRNTNGIGTTWGPATLVGTGWNPTRSYLADLDGDGRDDLVYVYDDGTAKAFRNINGISSNWGPPQVIGIGWELLRALFGDLDGDGRDDLTYLYPDGTKAFRNINGISDTWGPPTLIGLGWEATRAFLTDLDADGRDDLAYVYADGNIVAYQNLNGISDTWGPPQVIVTGANPWRTLFADLDGDLASIVANEPSPAVVPGWVAATVEGNTGTKTVTVPVTLSAASSMTVTVRYAPYNASGWASYPADFDVGTGTLTFAPGELSKTITMTIKGDTIDEPDEGAAFALSNPTNATVGGYGVGGVSVTDDD